MHAISKRALCSIGPRLVRVRTAVAVESPRGIIVQHPRVRGIHIHIAELDSRLALLPSLHSREHVLRPVCSRRLDLGHELVRSGAIGSQIWCIGAPDGFASHRRHTDHDELARACLPERICDVDIAGHYCVESCCHACVLRDLPEDVVAAEPNYVHAVGCCPLAIAGLGLEVAQPCCGLIEKCGRVGVGTLIEAVVDACAAYCKVVAEGVEG